MFPEPIEADSLVLRRLSPGRVDVFALYELFGRPNDAVQAVFEHVPQEPYESPRDAHDWLETASGEWDDREAAKYAVYRGGEELIGVAALGLDWDRRFANLAVMLDEPHWGEGYGTECALALTDVAFERLDLELVVLAHEAGNERSKAAIESFVERVGGQYDGVLRNWTRVGDEVLDTHRYTVAREEYDPPGE